MVYTTRIPLSGYIGTGGKSITNPTNACKRVN